MKYNLYAKEFQIYKKDFYVFPTIRLLIDNLVYIDRNFAIEFHFLIFHGRLLFLKRGD